MTNETSREGIEKLRTEADEIGGERANAMHSLRDTLEYLIAHPEVAKDVHIPTPKQS